MSEIYERTVKLRGASDLLKRIADMRDAIEAECSSDVTAAKGTLLTVASERLRSAARDVAEAEALCIRVWQKYG